MHCKYFPLFDTKALEKFSKALYGTTGGTYSARVFRPVMNICYSPAGRSVLGKAVPSVSSTA